MSELSRRRFILPRDKSCPIPDSCAPRGFAKGCQEAVIVRRYPFLAAQSTCNHSDAVKARNEALAESNDESLDGV